MISKPFVKPILTLVMIVWLAGCTTGTVVPAVTSTLPASPIATATAKATSAIETPTPPTVSPTIDPSRGRPPGARLTINDQTQEAGVGSYCWMTRDGTSATDVCADFVGVPTARDPLVITGVPPYSAHFHLENPTPPDSLYLTLTPVRPDGEIPSANPSYRFWKPGSGWSGGLPLKTDVDYLFKEGDGLYLAQLTTHWKYSGDVTYGFFIQIGAGSGGLPSRPFTTTPGPDPSPKSFTFQRLSPAAVFGKGTDQE